MVATTASDFKAVTVVSGTGRMKDSFYILLPSFLAKLALESSERTPEGIVELFIEAMKEFDDQNSADASLNEAASSLENILPFLWGATQDKILPLDRLTD